MGVEGTGPLAPSLYPLSLELERFVWYRTR